ncbi:hypothetical protein KIH74_32810 [Kineosporia sp. J2-2]|uniref:Integral membrane protein n=1 Tax=Kineosporia corallincola TaxID=2835133 RepID=A0ABS5TSM1_9ACTN|nr:hypothetical protein [Kineosporia corallincola]MBT0773773.1 hypothetical protein [Kineosporia corallincola]
MPGISLGLQSPYGFDGDDLTSPAQAARAGALVDQQWENRPELPLELRIHGVSGSTGPVILEHPNVVQVAGSRPTAFYRRWSPDGVGRPSVPWPLEAYVWGGLTARALASASWLLLLPFMLYNVAYYMLPAGDPKGRGRRLRSAHALARVVIRLLALAATAQFVGSLVTLFHSTIAWQNGVDRMGSDWWWLSWYTDASTATRMSVATVAVAAVICALWYAGAATASHYEAFSTGRGSYAPGVQVGGENRRDRLPSGRLTLRDRGFWRGASAAARLRNTHIAVAFAVISLALAGCTDTFGLWQQVQIGVSATILVAAVILAGFVADRDTVGGNDDVARFATTFKALAWVSGLVLLAGVVASPWVIDSAPAQTRHAAPHGLLGAVTALTLIQFSLVAVLLVLVAVLLHHSPDKQPAGWEPFLRGYAAPVITLLAVLLGGVLTAALNLSVARIFGEPNGVSLHKENIDTANTILLPDSMFAYSAGAVFNLAPMLVIAAWLYLRYRRMTKRFAAREKLFGDQVDGGPDPVVDWYPPDERDAPQPAVTQVARHWALASLTDQVAAVIGTVTVCWAAFFWVFEGMDVTQTSQAFSGVAGIVPTLGVFIGGLLAASGVWVLRTQIRSPNARKTVGIIWDVGTFWPRAVHPLAPPCYAEQAVPEVVDRIWVLTGATHADGRSVPLPGETSGAIEVIPRHVLLTGYSQGTAISVAVIAQLPEDVLGRVSLMTLAAPLRRLYGRAFPAYFGHQAALALRDLLSGPHPESTRNDPPEPSDVDPAPPNVRAPEPPSPRWRNVVRRSDYIGGWVFGLPRPQQRVSDEQQVDVISLDPPSLEPEHGSTLAPTHFHSSFWQDPVVISHARELTDR